MGHQNKASVYSKAVNHLVLTFAALVFALWFLPIMLAGFGVPSRLLEILTTGCLALTVLIGGLRTFLIACPKCGKSLFVGGIMSVPWPQKRCSRCGSNLTQPRP